MTKAIGTPNDPTKALGRMLARTIQGVTLSNERAEVFAWARAALNIETPEQWAAVVTTGQEMSALTELAGQTGYVVSRRKAAAQLKAAHEAEVEFLTAIKALDGLPAEITAPVVEALTAKRNAVVNAVPALIDDPWLRPDGKGRVTFAPAPPVAPDASTSTPTVNGTATK